MRPWWTASIPCPAVARPRNGRGTPPSHALRRGIPPAQRDRKKSIFEQASSDLGRLRTEIGTLDGRIETRADEGVKELLADVRGRLASARDALQRFDS